MNSNRALKIILAIAIVGVLFSGTLTYRELFSKTAATCPSLGQAGNLLGYPACVYGLLMYVALVIVAILGLRKKI